MAVVKKKRTYNTKSSRLAAAQQAQKEQELQKQNLQAIHHLEDTRLKSESQGTGIIHDESDSISFRSHLLNNFINSSGWVNALTLKPISLSNLKPAVIYGSPKVMKQSLIDMEAKLNKELDQIKDLKEEIDNQTVSHDNNEHLLSILDLKNMNELDFSSLDSINKLLDIYKNKYCLRSQDYKIVRHDNKFTDLKPDSNEAPSNYWEIINDMKLKQKERREEKIRLALEKKKKEEEEKRAKEEAERIEMLFNERQEKEKLEKEEKDRIAKEMETKLAQEQDLIRQQEQSDIVGTTVPELPPTQMPATVFSQDITAPLNPSDILPTSIEDVDDVTNSTSNLLNVDDNTTNPNNVVGDDAVGDAGEGQEMLDDMFGQYNNEQFNNGFDDGFEDLDNVFF